MARFANSVLFTPASAGTVDFVVSAAVQGYMTPALAGAPTGVYKYRAESADLSQWEIGEGTYTSGTTTLTRTTVLYNSAGTGSAAGQSGAGSKINFTVAPNVGIVQTVDDTLGIDQANTWTDAQTLQGRVNLALGPPDVIIEELQASGTHGGSSAASTLNQRTLNTMTRNKLGIGALSSNQFTLPAGTYYVEASAPVWRADQHMLILRNVTDTLNAGLGTSEYSANATDNAQSRSYIAVEFTIAASKAFTLLHYTLLARASTGLGIACSLGVTERYAVIKIWKVKP